MVLKDAMTIDEAEKQYTDYLDKLFAREKRVAIVGIPLYVMVIVAVLIPVSSIPKETFPPIILVGILLFLCIGGWVLLKGIGFARVIDEEPAEHIRSAQYSWVEAHGLTLSQGAFASLGFPLVPLKDTGSSVYGTAQVLVTKSNKLIFVTLERSSSGEYFLRGANGRHLKPHKGVNISSVNGLKQTTPKRHLLRIAR